MKSERNTIAKNSLLVALFLIMTFSFVGCNNELTTGNTVTTATENITGYVSVKINVPEPDQIIVGADGKSVTLSKSSDDYIKIAKMINSRFSKSTVGEIDAGYSRVYEDGKIVLKDTDYFRTNEVYVEYIYDTTHSVSFETLDPSSCTDFTRIIFPVTGSANSNFIVASEENYSNNLDTTHHYATLIANTDIIAEIQRIIETSHLE